ncbi:MAG: hypothetical protein ACF8QF_14375 [Phycisphaerales bacterium]
MLSALTRCAAAWIVGVLVASVASAHPMLLLGAEMTVSGGDLRIEFRPSDADLEHLRIDPASDGAATSFANLVGASLMVADDFGSRIALYATADGAVAGVVDERATALTLWITPESPLAIRGGQAQIRTALRAAPLRLMRAGNAEIVRLGRVPAPVEPGEAWLWQSRFDGISALVEREANAVIVDVVAPLRVAETWQPMARSGTGLIDAASAAADLDAFGATMLEGVRLNGAGGRLPGRVVRVSLLGPTMVRSDSPDEPLGAPGASVWVRLRFDGDDGSADLVWSAFNAGVHRVRVSIGGGSEVRPTRTASAIPIPPCREGGGRAVDAR